MNGGNGHRRPYRKKVRGEFVVDDDFSNALKSQGKDGAKLRLLYLQNEYVTYRKRLLDEPIRY